MCVAISGPRGLIENGTHKRRFEAASIDALAILLSLAESLRVSVGR
jgi:hypothetical protein